MGLLIMDYSPCAAANRYLRGRIVWLIPGCDQWLCVWIQEEEVLDVVALTAAALRALQLDRCRDSLRCCLSLTSPFFALSHPHHAFRLACAWLPACRPPKCQPDALACACAASCRIGTHMMILSPCLSAKGGGCWKPFFTAASSVARSPQRCPVPTANRTHKRRPNP